MKFNSFLLAFIISFFSTFHSQAQTIALCNGAPLCIQGYSTGIWDGPGISSYTATCITPATSGTYTCQTIDLSGSPGIVLTFSVALLSKPVLTYTAQSPAGCVPEFTFNGSASIASGSIASYQWTFGDGATDSSFPSTTHDYAASGIYTTQLKAISSDGCADSVASTLTVSTLPDLSFQSSSTCLYSSIHFTNTSTIQSPGSISSYTWNFGNGAISTALNPSVTYTSYGTYTVTLVATTALGCTTSAAGTVLVYPNPQLTITPGSFCSRKSILFNTLPTSATLTNYSWQFFQAVPVATFTSNLANPSFTLASGISTVMLTGTTSDGCLGGDTLIVTIKPTPTVSFNSQAADLCSLAYSFSYTGVGQNNYSWVFDGTTTGTQNDNSFTYPGPGNYTVTAIATTTAGCADTAYHAINIFPTPVLNFSVSTTCVNSTFSVSASASASITGHTWDFGDPSSSTNTSTLLSPSHTYSISSSYTLTSLITNSIGCTFQTTLPINIYPIPSISISSGSICSGQSFSLNPTGASTYTYLNGSAVVTPTATKTYSVIGKSAFGCAGSNTAIGTVTVYITPTITAINGTICSGNSFTFSGNGATLYSTASGSTIVSPANTSSYLVNGTSAQGCVSANSASVTITVNPVPTISVNSGTICAGKTFTILPVSSSTYAVSGGTNLVSPLTSTYYIATATNSLGCSASAFSNVYVLVTPTLSVNSGTICSGDVFTLSPSGAISYTYSGGSSIVTPSTSTGYTITGVGSTGCTNTAVSSVTVYITPTITVNNATLCTGTTFTLMPTGASSYSYSNGSQTITPLVSTSIAVTGISPFGCSNSAISNITVFVTPTITVNSSTLCQGSSFTITPSGANSYTLSNGISVVSPTSNASYTVTGISVQGCTANAVSSLTVFTAPFISVNSGSICEGNSFTFTPSGAANYTFSNGSSVVTPTSTSSYTVTGTNTLGCSNTNHAVSTVSVNPVPVLQVLSTNSAMCAGETSTLLASGAVSYTWTGHTPASYIFITPTVTTEYTVTGRSSQGCFQTMVYTQNVSICAGITETKELTSYLSIYPNPNNGTFTLKYDREADLRILNTLGQTIRSVSLTNSNSYATNLNELAEGIYFIVSQDGKLFKQKIIVSH